jgi:hypothetical protein
MRGPFTVGTHNLLSMKPSLSLLPLTAALLLVNGFAVSSLASSPPPIPINQLGAVAGKQYQGDGLSVRAAATGAELRCAFQRLEGEVTSAGLWLRSTADGAAGERFRVLATGVGRTDDFGLRRQSAAPPPLWPGDLGMEAVASFESGVAPATAGFPPQSKPLQFHGTISVREEHVQFHRPGVTEEYSVSVDGVRQDFLIAQPPVGTGELRLELDVTGAAVAPLGNGVRLTLPGSGRQLAYHRLHVTDATGRELPARMEVAAERPAATKLAVLVNDANAVYPVRIDPTFSDADWVSLGGFPGTGGLNGRTTSAQVYAAASDEAGNLYIGGGFRLVHNVHANFIAKWDGTNWSALGAGLNSNVYALAVSGTNLYVGGVFTEAGGVSANRVAKWNGTVWSAIGDGVSDTVRALAVSGNSLYVGGQFTNAGGVAANHVAHWDGANWSPLGEGVKGEAEAASVLALAISGSDLYVGGEFNSAGGATANYIARWNGNTWSPLGVGVSAAVRSLLVAQGDLFVGGNFWEAGGIPANRIAKWDGSAWSPMGAGRQYGVTAIAMLGGLLHVGESGASGIAKWDGSTWTTLGRGVYYGGDMARTLAVSGTNLYVGGWFEFAGLFSAQNIVRWDGQDWSTIGDGMDTDVRAVAVEGANLYAAGGWQGMYGRVRVGKWNGAEWATLGKGVASGLVWALATSGASNVYAGGTFNVAGDAYVNNVAQWNGSAWLPLATGVNNWVRAIAANDTNVYVGGDFTTASGIPANRIARWDGSAWHPLGAGLDAGVYALQLSGEHVYAGGDFTSSSGIQVNHIARWDGTAWSALGDGLDGAVHAIAINGSNVYVGGTFTNAGNTQANNIAVWDGHSWASLGGGLGGNVTALTISGNSVYAGGEFTNASGIAVNYLAKWDGISWSPVGSGVDRVVRALVVAGPRLYVGGSFLSAGGKLSAFVAQANIATSPGRFVNPSYSPDTGFSCTFLDGTPGRPYYIQILPSKFGGTWTDLIKFSYAEPVTIKVPPMYSAAGAFLRAYSP